MNRPIGSGWPMARARLATQTVGLVAREMAMAEGRMRSEAPWVDRSGIARGALDGDIVPSPTPGVLVVGVLSHGVDYGRWLSTIHGTAMGRRASMPPEQLALPQYAGPLDPIHPAAREAHARIVAGVGRIWGAS